MDKFILIRGGGDLASGVALRLHRVGMHVLITELAQPLVVRRLVSFAEAIYRGQTRVEELLAEQVNSFVDIQSAWNSGNIPVMVDPDCSILKEDEETAIRFDVLVDARMTKGPPYLDLTSVPMIIGLGPGFVAGVNCHAVVETKRGHFLGRVIWQGSAIADSGIPDGYGTKYHDRVLRSPADGLFIAHSEICTQLQAGDLIAEVNSHQIRAPFEGILRGLLHDGLQVSRGLKVGDLDPRNDPIYCTLVSDKSLAIAGGVLEAVLSTKTLKDP